MDPVTVTFLAIGGLAVSLLLVSLLGHEFHTGHLHIGAGGIPVTLPTLAGFLGAFGFGGAVVAAISPWRDAGTAVLATAVGLVVALPTTWLVGRLMAAAINMPTDATPTSGDLIGAIGVVVTPVPAEGLGEVRVTVAGAPMKLHARADRPLALGTEVFVIAVPSPTSVLVEPTIRAMPLQ